MSPHRRRRLGLVGSGLLGSALLWVVVLLVNRRWGSHWPPATWTRWEDLLTLALIVEFLTLKSWLMIRRTWRWDRLGASIVAANLAFALLYLWVIEAAFLSPLREERWVVSGLRLLLVATTGWGVVELIRTAGEDEPEP